MASQVANRFSVTGTDIPNRDYYYTGEISRITGFSVNQTVRLEVLGAHPASSGDQQVWGMGWSKAAVDDFVHFLGENPEYRAWLESLLGDAPTTKPKDIFLDEVR